jgi:hypothetical protein
MTTTDHAIHQEGQTLPFTIPNRTLVKRGSARGQLSTFHLEEVRDYLKKLEAAQEPKDYERSLNQLHVDFVGGNMTAQLLTRTGLDPEKLVVTDHGSSLLARDVLPARFFGGLRQLAQLDEQGEKLASMSWMKFSRLQDKPRMIRTVRMRVEDAAGQHQVRRAVRSCHSQGYAPYSNLEFVQDMLDHAGEFASLPVLDWHVSDAVMRLRFAGTAEGQLELDKPVPMLETWNSEVGLRRVGLRGGMWKLTCTNGMGHWDERKEWNWIHRGDSSRIQSGVRSAFQDLLVSASGVVDAYDRALDVAIDDAFAWVNEELNRTRVPERIIGAAQKALHDPLTTPGGSLASVVDAITLIAQEEDILGQYEIERAAANIMRRGLSASLKNNGRIIAST